MTTILIADDHRMIRESWSAFLARDERFEIIGNCSDSLEAVQLSGMLRPHVLLIDINMEPFSGIEATRRVREVSPMTGIIAVTLHNKVEMVGKSLSAGARGYVTKDSSAKELKTAIFEVSEGRVFLSSDMKALLAQEKHEPARLSSLGLLTNREKEIINLIKLGHTTKCISSELAISTHTVDIHRHSIMTKLKVKNAAELIALVYNSELYA